MGRLPPADASGTEQDPASASHGRKAIGLRIRNLVEAHFSSQRAAADALGVSKTTLLRYLKGESGVDFEFVIRLCKATGVTVDHIALGKASDVGIGAVEILEARVFEAAQMILNATRYLEADRSIDQIATAIARRSRVAFMEHEDQPQD
jgi:transcriptional regulator with XRE-family HTH domain